MKKRLSYLFAAGILISAVTIYSCKKSSSDPVLPQIGGYNNSDEVAAANLKAHWGFDGNANEAISSTAPATSLRATFVAGIKGQAVKLDSGYLLYPTIAALNLPTLGSATVSAWVYTDNTNGRTTSLFTWALAGAAQTDWNMGPLNMYFENGRPTTYDDTLVLHSAMATYVAGTRLGGDNINDYGGVREVDYKTVHGTNKWVQYILKYDASGSFLDIYANGVLVSNSNYRYKYVGATAPGTPFGPILLPNALSTTQVLIGGFANTTTGFTASNIQGWQGLYRGNIDELRVYNKALTAAEITALYQLELAGR